MRWIARARSSGRAGPCSVTLGAPRSISMNADQMADLMKRDLARWHKSIREIGGIKVD